MRTLSHLTLSTLLALALCGCGLSSRTDFPNALTGPGGEVILFDDVSDILNDSGLSDNEKREALRTLGLEDERLIDALIEA